MPASRGRAREWHNLSGSDRARFADDRGASAAVSHCNLTTIPTEGEAIVGELALVEVPAGARLPPASPPAAAALNKGIQLLGYDWCGPTGSAGRALSLTLYWKVGANIRTDNSAFVHIGKARPARRSWRRTTTRQARTCIPPGSGAAVPSSSTRLSAPFRPARRLAHTPCSPAGMIPIPTSAWRWPPPTMRCPTVGP
jgi:hypothetical protein